MTIYSVRYTPSALADMEALWDSVYEASRSYDVADRYVDEFAELISAKKEWPYSGIPLLYRGLFTGFYYVVYKKYIVFYRINGDFIDVLRILMAKTDYLTVLLGEVSDDVIM